MKISGGFDFSVRRRRLSGPLPRRTPPMKTARETEFRLPAISRYEFEKKIGEGGMGVVYRALDRDTGRRVAIKVFRFRPGDHPTLFRRIDREFRAASALDHPNIVRALAFDSDGDRCYLVFELVEGGSLGDHLERHGPLAEAVAVRVVTQVAQALHHAHAAGVVHRDVKPDNVLLQADGRVKLTDFGLAKEVDAEEDLTRQASGLGTPNYMAPEQFYNARGADVRCDVYSLAATLYHLLTGRLPFDARTDLVMLTKKQKGVGTSPRELEPWVSERVDAAVRAALDPDPDRRPQTMLAFFRALTARTRLGRPAPVRLRPSARPDDRRVAARYELKVGAVGAVESGVHGGGEEVWPLVVRDVSGTGVGITLARRFEVGTRLAVEVHAGLDAPAQRYPARVVRVFAEPGGYWGHGCVFDAPLADDEVARLIRFA
jgi:serine/threonine protein kinase